MIPTSHEPDGIRIWTKYTCSLVCFIIFFILVNFVVIESLIKSHVRYKYKVHSGCKCTFQGSVIFDDPNEVWTGDTACFQKCIDHGACKAAEQTYHELGEGVSTCKLYAERCPKLTCVETHSMVSDLHHVFYMEVDEIEQSDYL